MLKTFRAYFFLLVFIFVCSLHAEESNDQEKVEDAISKEEPVDQNNEENIVSDEKPDQKIPKTTSSKDDEILVKALKGIIILSPEIARSRKECSKLKKKQIAGFEGIYIKGLSIPDESDFYDQMESFLGKPITFDFLQTIKQSIIRFYKKQGFNIADVTIPAGQEITSGVVQFVVCVGKLGKVAVEGGKYFSKKQIRNLIRTEKGEEIAFDQMQEDLLWINDNPFRNVSLLFEPGENVGETDVNLHLSDRYPLRFYGGYENTGNLIAGTSRYLAGVNWGNFFKLDHRFNYQYMCAFPMKKWHGHSYSYIAPLSWRNILKVFGSYVKTKPKMEDGLFLSKGKSWYAAFRYHVPFKTGDVQNEFYFGYDFKRTNNFLSYQTELIFNTYMDISQLILGQEGLYEYKIGSTSWNLVLYLSPGKTTKYNRDKYFRAERDGAKANYFYFDLYFDQTLFMPYDFSWVLTSQFQYATGKLLPTEQLSLGGYYTVRGYQENKVISDRGILLRNEIRTPAINLSEGKTPRKHDLQFLGFIDFGWAADVDQNILSKESTILASVGVGCRYNLMNYITFRFDYGWQLESIHRIIDDSGKHSRFHLGLILSY